MANGVVLVVDDDLSIRKGVSQLLEKSGYAVFQAGNGQEAIDLLREGHDIDLVLLDLMMPVMSGHEALKIIKVLPDSPAVIVMTAVGDPQAEQDSLAGGSIDYVRKPFKLNSLLLKVHNHVLARRNLERQRFRGVVQMADTLCHNINQPLTAVLGYADMVLNDNTLSTKSKDYLTKLNKAAVAIKNIVQKVSCVRNTSAKIDSFSGVDLIDIGGTKDE